MLKGELGVFLLAVQFLTRLPVPRDLPFSDARLTRATRYYPLVGLLVGATGAVVLWGAGQVLPASVAVLLSLAATLFATGAFHEDGLADAADGLGGGMSRDRALEIMRDSRIGTYGAVTLGTALALKVATLANLPLRDAVVTLVLGHALARMAAVQVIATSEYTREDGAKFASPTIDRPGHGMALGTTGLALAAGAALIGPLPVLAGVVAAWLVAGLFRRIFLSKLGGYTGDCLGGIAVLAELGFYLGVASWT